MRIWAKWPTIFTTLHFLFNWVLQTRVLHNTRLERLAKHKHSSFLGPFVSYEENEVLWIQPKAFYHSVKALELLNSSLVQSVSSLWLLPSLTILHSMVGKGSPTNPGRRPWTSRGLVNAMPSSVIPYRSSKTWRRCYKTFLIVHEAASKKARVLFTVKACLCLRDITTILMTFLIMKIFITLHGVFICNVVVSFGTLLQYLKWLYL